MERGDAGRSEVSAGPVDERRRVGQGIVLVRFQLDSITRNLVVDESLVSANAPE